MTHSRLVKRAATAGACVMVGTCAGIAGSAASPAKSSASAKSTKARRSAAAGATQTTQTMPAPAGVVAFKLGFGGPPVHGVETVANKAGDGFDTVTLDSGTVSAVSGDHVTITEGTDKATYATPTLTIAAGATVERNFQDGELADVRPGDHVDVSASSDGTESVFAMDPQHWPPKPPIVGACGKAGALPLPPGAKAGAVSGIGTVTAVAGSAGPPQTGSAAGPQAGSVSVQSASATLAAGRPGGGAAGMVCVYKAP
jgi:hypothetical protein